MPEVLIIIVLGLALIGAGVALSWKLKRDRLMAKYGDANLVAKLMAGTVWQGMTREQLIDSQGRPEAIDEKVFKTKTKHTFKHGKTGKNRYATRIEVENGIVVGWSGR